MSTQSQTNVLPEQAEVLVIGAGPVGMTLALTLRRAGVEVVLVDKAPTTRRFSQAAILWPRTLEILDLLGIVEDWRAVSVPIRAFTLLIDGIANNLELDHENSPHPQPYGVGQDVTEALLETRVRQSGARLYRETEAVGLDMDANGATATLKLASGETKTLRASWVVGCEGGHSITREAAGIARKGERNAGAQLMQGDVRIGGELTLAAGRGYLASSRSLEGLFVMPIDPAGHYRVLVMLPDDGAKEPPTLEQLEAQARQFVPGIELHDPVWLNRYRTQHQIAERYRAGRAFVAGDAAHVWVPVGGQGMNIGMQDAFDLGWKLADVVKGRLPEAMLDTYDAERRPIGERNIADTEAMYGALFAPDDLGDRIRRKLMPHLLGVNRFRAFMADRFSELDVHYAPSALVVDQGHDDGPAPGRLAPDAYVSHMGATIRLYDLFHSGKWVTLGWALENDDLAAQQALAGLNFGDVYLVDASRQGVGGWTGTTLRDFPRLATMAYGVKRPCLRVIRPDGIIGYAGPADRAKLEAYFAGIGIQFDPKVD